MYRGLIEEINNLKQRTARFRKVALHIHSIDSYDWARGITCDKQSNSRDLLKSEDGKNRFIQKLESNFDLCAITDHMKCGYSTALSMGALQNEKVVVLPGMEVNFKPEAALGNIRIHLLVILEAGASNEDFARLFEGQTEIPNDQDRRGNEEIKDISLNEFIERVHNNGGICIAAHVDSEKGIRCRFRQTARETLRLFSSESLEQQEQENNIGENLKEYLFNSHIDAIEIHNSSSTPHYCWISEINGQKKWIPTVLTFDAHCIEHFNRPDRISYLKMTNLNLNGLKDSLKFPDTRIRFPSNLPDPPCPTLMGIRISGDESSFFENLTVTFAENLNCIIGVRGSGKSTLVEALRYVFGYNRSLGDIGVLAKPIKELQNANLCGCLIQIAYLQSNGDIRILSSTFDGKSDYTTKVYTQEGDFCEVADVESCGEYPLRLFGWSEIETLGRDHRRQRELLDRLMPELNPKLEQRNELRKELKRNRNLIDKAITELKLAYEQNDNEITRYTEFKTDFNNLNTEDVKTLFAELDLEKEKRAVLVQVYENANHIKDDLTSSDRKWLYSDLNEILDKGSDDLRNWWLGEESKELNIVEFEAQVKQEVESAARKVEQLAELIASHVRQIKSRIDELNANLQKQFEGDTSLQKVADLRANAEGRLKKVDALRKSYLEKFDHVREALTKRTEIANKLLSIQNEISGIRSRYNERLQETLNRFLPDWMNVSISLKSGGDSDNYDSWLYKLFGARSNQAKNLRDLISKNVPPVNYSKFIFDENFSGLVEIDNAIGNRYDISQDDLNLNMEKTRIFEKDEAADVFILRNRGEQLNQYLDLHEIDWDDKETILLNDVPINQKSPGQRSSAMLPLIALAEKTPLVIDQPEDNLDKRLVGTVLANVLSELKEQRQIIVCTHDPNILVGGDAEQIIVLNAESDRRGTVQNHGSIDNNDIIQTVVDLLEGGDEAFEKREKRYANRA